jgi:hypothetical protein
MIILQSIEGVEVLSLFEKTSLPSISRLRHRRCRSEPSVERKGRVQVEWRGEAKIMRALPRRLTHDWRGEGLHNVTDIPFIHLLRLFVIVGPSLFCLADIGVRQSGWHAGCCWYLLPSSLRIANWPSLQVASRTVGADWLETCNFVCGRDRKADACVSV